MKRTSWRHTGENRSPTARLETLADGVFAIVMTLLVLELAVPVVTEGTSAEVAEALREMWPDFLIYALSFLVLGVFWLMHKMIFDSLVRSDPPLMWLNIVFLMVTALVPFSTALVGEYRAVPIGAVVYGLNMLLAFGIAWGIWAYATGPGKLAAEDLNPVLVTGGNRMGLVYLLVMAGCVTVAFFSASAAFVAYAVFVGTFILAPMPRIDKD